MGIASCPGMLAAHTGLVKIAAALGVVCMSVAEGLGVAPGPIPNDNVTGGKFRDGALNIFGGVVIFVVKLMKKSTITFPTSIEV